jgi:hypothetical protein
MQEYSNGTLRQHKLINLEPYTILMGRKKEADKLIEDYKIVRKTRLFCTSFKKNTHHLAETKVFLFCD